MLQLAKYIKHLGWCELELHTGTSCTCGAEYYLTSLQQFVDEIDKYLNVAALGRLATIRTARRNI